MHAYQLRESLLERRQNNNASDLWASLSLTQKFAASSLIQSGYEMAFIRSTQADRLAVFLHDDNTATVSSEGKINTSPNIVLR